MVKVIVADRVLDCTDRIGTFLDENDYDTLVDYDCNGYLPALCDMEDKVCCEKNCGACDIAIDEERVAFVFRKNFFTLEEQKDAYDGLHLAAQETQNRGNAAGPRGNILSTEGRRGREFVSDYQYEVLEFLTAPLNSLYESNETVETIRDRYTDIVATTDTRGKVWLVSKVCEKYPDYTGWFDAWLDDIKMTTKAEQAEAANFVIDKWISVTNYAKNVKSGVAGYFDRYPRIPFCRDTSYTRNNPELFKKSFTFLQKLDDGFKEFLPKRWAYQRACCDKLDPNFVVSNTVFTTLTVNKTFRTAAHLDAGDLEKGFSNLSVITDGKTDYKGGYLVFPEVRIAVNIRPGDLLLVANHCIIHGNTELEVPEGKELERVSLVCYFREKLLEGGSYEYEKCRENFVEDRRHNKAHRLQRPLWNGISPNCFFEKEWYDYLESNLGYDTLKKYHPEACLQNLEDLM